MAWLLAVANPTLSSLAISRTSGNRSRTIWAEPSAESLSTTQVSTDSPALACSTDRSACSRNSRTLYVTMTTDTSTVAAGASVRRVAGEKGIGTKIDAGLARFRHVPVTALRVRAEPVARVT